MSWECVNIPGTWKVVPVIPGLCGKAWDSRRQQGYGGVGTVVAVEALDTTLSALIFIFITSSHITEQSP